MNISQLLRAFRFEEQTEEIVELNYSLSDSSAFERRAFSSLHLISAKAFERGLADLRRDLQNGPIPCTSKYVMYRGLKRSPQ